MNKQDIITLVQEEDVRFIRLQFTDMLGHIRNMAITVPKLKDALDNKCMFDGSAIKGFAEVEASDLYLYPDLNTFTIFPWRPHQGKVARLICDVYTPDGKPLIYDPRTVLKNAINEASDMGYVFEVGAECEFFLFKTDDDGNPIPQPHDDATYFDVSPIDGGENCRRDICLTLEDMGYEVEASHHEIGRGQHEIVLKYTDALTMADRLVTFQMVTKTIARRNGFHATFMPKPFAGEPGNGMHLTMSLVKDGENVFYDKNDPKRLSDIAYKFIAGMLKYTSDMVCITNPTVNSYKRLIPGYEAPCYISWSDKNRSLLVRVPSFKEANEARVEYRAPDPTSNPYLALAACLRAGLNGIKEGLSLPPSIDVNIYKLTESERQALGVENLPISLNEALKIASGSDFVTQVLGEEFKKLYINTKAAEYEEYRKIISRWELEKYMIQY